MRKILFLSLTTFLVGGAVFFSCRKSDHIVPNKPLIAQAGLDQVITLPTDSVLLDGNGSGNPDGTISEWLWTKISGPASFTIDNATLSKTMARNLTAGIYQFELKVASNESLLAKDTIKITVNGLSRPPLANAGGDTTLKLLSCAPPGTVFLDGSGSSDPDNDISGYSWTQISGPSASTLFNSTSVKATVGNLFAGQYVFQLQVTDAGGSSSKDTMKVNVLGAAEQESDLDLTLSGSFLFQDNYEDCYYYCSYYDYTSIQIQFDFPSIGQFNFYTQEYADTASASDVHTTSMSLYRDNGPGVNGTSSINFKKLIQKGGGSFSGTLKIEQGSAQNCNQNIYTNLNPLTVTGSLDTTMHSISLTIKGKTYL